MYYPSRWRKRHALETIQHGVASKAGKPRGQIASGRQTSELCARHSSKANKAENIKDVKLFFKELLHCMKAITESEKPD